MSSEVARLRTQIEENYIAAQRGLNGYKETARHVIINSAFAAIQPSLEELENLIGEKQAMEVVIQVMEQHSPEQGQQPV
jgi:hypothetical protein